MKTVLVLSVNPAFPETIASAISTAGFKTVHRVDVAQAEPLLRAGIADFCIIDFEADQMQGAWVLDQVRRMSPALPIIVFIPESNMQWMEEAYLHGAEHVLTKPVRSRALATLLERQAESAKPQSPKPVSAGTPARLTAPNASTEMIGGLRPSSVLQTLNVARDFSVILTHSLHAESLLKEFLLLTRSILGVNRAAIFLRQRDNDLRAEAPRSPMRSAYAVGLANELINHIDLSYETGIGGYLARSGRILRRDEPVALADDEVQKEFEVLGAQVAVPILDRETMVGVALFDGRVTGESLSNAELESIFHLLEGLALAVRNIWRHDQMATHSELLASVLRELSNACVVVNQDLQVVHANKSARQYFGRSGKRGADLEFSDLPAGLGTKLYQVLKTGTAIAPFRFEPPDAPKSVFQISILPLYRGTATTLPDSVLLVADDRTQAQQLQQLEVEAANLRLVRTMADRLAHEIGNALVPLSTHQQLLAEKYRDPEFRTSLDHALADSVKRISRLANQMRYLARDAVLMNEPLQLKSLIEEAYQEAQKHHPQKPAKLEYSNGGQSLSVAGDRSALKHAMAEVLLNALQANNSAGKIEVSAHPMTDPTGARWVEIAIEDAGEGFSPEAARRVPEPFYTTRNVGLGLGLTVSRKIIEVHHGRLQIEAPKIGHHGLVRISLPLQTAK